VNEALSADVEYRLTLEHAGIAARFAAGVHARTATERAKYDVAPVGEGAWHDGAVDVEDLVLILRNASGLAL
jgi:hypothetical protein